MISNEIEIPILTAGDYGEAGRWDSARLERVVQSYNPESFKAPLVVGHPATDAPAHGWVRSLRLAGDRLVARVGDLSEEIVRLAREGRYRKISAAFWPGDDQHPPRLKHVGLLGAALPRDASLPMVAFAQPACEAHEAVVHFTLPTESIPLPGDAPTWLGRLIALLARWLMSAQPESPNAPPASESTPGETAPEASADFAATENVHRQLEEAARLDRFLEAQVREGRLPPLFADRGGRGFLAALAALESRAAPAQFANADETQPANPDVAPLRWFMDTVARFPSALFAEEAVPGPAAPQGEEERLYQRAYERLDMRQELRRRGVPMALFRKVYTPEDCRRILIGQ